MQVGIDLGSRTIKTVALKGGLLLQRSVVESGFEPQRQALQMLGDHPQARVVATGYGRHLMQQHAELGIITEIKAHALGARHLFPHCRTILDVGGQDSKVIQLSENGRIVNFQMNDKCAAGTGRFLEMMAMSLGYPLQEFGVAAAQGDATTAINSMCAVFAESEVISLKNRGVPPAEIARSVHLAVASRLSAMVSKSCECRHLVFTGGVANNKTLVAMLEKALGAQVLVPEDPSIIGALGAALHAGSPRG